MAGAGQGCILQLCNSFISKLRGFFPVKSIQIGFIETWDAKKFWNWNRRELNPGPQDWHPSTILFELNGLGQYIGMFIFTA